MANSLDQASIVLYDAALGGTPEMQGKLIYRHARAVAAIQFFADGCTTLDTMANQQDSAGYIADPRALPALDRWNGYALRFTVQVAEEYHADSDKDGDGVGDRAGFSAIALGAMFMAATTVRTVALRHVIPLAFLGGDSAALAETAQLTASLLLLGATFFIADGLQTIVGGALRGINDTRMTLLFAAIGYWGIAFPVAWVLAFHTGLGAVGVWVGFSVGTFVYAALLILRFRMLTRRLAG